MQITLYTLSLFCFMASVTSLLRMPYWWIKISDVSRAHLAFLMAVLIVMILLCFPLIEWWTVLYLSLLCIGIVYHVSIIFPFTPLCKVELENTERNNLAIKILTANVRQKNEEYGRLLKLIAHVDPDVFLLTEINQKWLEAIEPFRKNYPHTIEQAQENTYGMVLFSKYGLNKAEVKFLVEDDVPSIHACLNFSGREIQILGMHPRPPTPWTKSEKKDIELIMIAGTTNDNNLPTIVTGDLNDVGWSRITKTFKNISGLLDPRIGRGFYSTYNALIPFFRAPIDHFFVSPHFKLLQIKRLEKIGSDHFPVMVEINLESY